MQKEPGRTEILLPSLRPAAYLVVHCSILWLTRVLRARDLAALRSQGKAVSSEQRSPLLRWLVPCGRVDAGNHGSHRTLYTTRVFTMNFNLQSRHGKRSTTTNNDCNNAPYSKLSERALSRHLLWSFCLKEACALLFGRAKLQHFSPATQDCDGVSTGAAVPHGHSGDRGSS